MDMTKEQLIDAIREAGSLGELQRLVGAPDHENEQAKLRNAQLDALSPRCEWDKMECQCGSDARQARERWGRLVAEQSAYENKWC